MSIFTRKTKQIYKWDDSFSIHLFRDINGSSSLPYSWVCPDDSYTHHLSTTVQYHAAAGIRFSQIFLRVLDGGEDVLQSSLAAIPGAGTLSYHFNSYHAISPGGTPTSNLYIPTPDTFYLTPGMTLQVFVNTPLAGDQVDWITILMKSWNLR